MNLPTTLALALSMMAAATPLVPSALTFPSVGHQPSFSLRLGNDTASVCNSSTPGVSGFIDSSDDSHLFFWLFESKNDAATDPVILWMTGGPGGSSASLGNLMELGPCLISPDGGYTVDNPYGWNANATLLFVDQPASVGYSYAPTIPRGLHNATTAMHTFLSQFFTAFPQLADRDFYIAGESYGGAWVSALGERIVKTQSASSSSASRLSKQFPLSLFPSAPGPKSINLKGIMIGNGLLRQSYQNPGIFETACSGHEPILNASQCEGWAPLALWCSQNMIACETEGVLSKECMTAQKKCNGITDFLVEELGLNPFNYKSPCDNPPLCYSAIDHISEYMTTPAVKDALGVAPNGPYLALSEEVLQIWDELGDTWKRSDTYVNYLLDQNIRVLVYVGDSDLYAHAAGHRRMIDEGLAWYGQPFFRFRPLHDWYLGVRAAGRGKSFGPLTYAEIYNAGHLAPMDKGEELLKLINSWIKRSWL
ncbi:hypothetical protein LCI18_004603 [Fusarium solani-melongenae]|uniref:Uncharacterized protein n=1 Tax=Fusarium solani subsp. cucurbitae TaxID=2747967 RepID=A0ACD3YXE6_FUSSC|nr:hypothetical protein LCI18_004603 [Fusarium solani-melongenae]